MPGGAAGLQNQSGGRKVPGGFDSLPSPPSMKSIGYEAMRHTKYFSLFLDPQIVRLLSEFSHRTNCLVETMTGIITGALGCSAK